jgi:penicillin-binding protein 1C
MKKSIPIIAIIAALTILLTPIPNLQLPYSKVVYDKDSQLLSARIASDEQWRFPIEEDLPKQLEQAIIHFEDEYFYRHPGFNPVSIAKAVYLNSKSKKIKRGGSTITMQVMRMYHGNKRRTYSQKVIELLGAVKLELLYSKKEILKMWATVAPFGGNTVGASTASWRYFNRNLDQLSWAEYATLAVLPNAPSKVHMTKNVAALKAKRDQLLTKLLANELLDSIEWELAIDEEINFKQKNLPQKSIHFMSFLTKQYPKQSIYYSTINPEYQEVLNDILDEYSKVYQFDGIENAAATVIDIQKNEVVAYVGNTKYKGKQMRFVDCVQAPRSYGSLLKPLLYTQAINQGYFLPNENIKDIPTNISGFIPKNFDRKYRGVVPMDEMVSKSLNIPAVRVLNYVGMESFHHLLKKELRFSFINNDPSHHGLSIILGGAECSMWEISRAYKGMVRNQYEMPNAYNNIKCLKNEEEEIHDFAFHPNSTWHALKAMMSVNRPKEEQHFMKLGGQQVAWKTGTSYGHRDAWAVGANERYVVAVWVGNENGNGVHNLIGARKAGPILFRMMRHLDHVEELKENIVDAELVLACAQSGMLKGHLCTETKGVYVPRNAHQLRHCDRHQVNYNKGRTNGFAVFAKAENTDRGVENDTLFYLNPVENYYHSAYSGEDLSLPVSMQQNGMNSSLNIVYPEKDAILFVPKKLENTYSKVQLRANTNTKDGTLFWFLNGEFLEKTKPPHHVSVDLETGKYELLINDVDGNRDAVGFEVVKRE